MIQYYLHIGIDPLLSRYNRPIPAASRTHKLNQETTKKKKLFTYFYAINLRPEISHSRSNLLRPISIVFDYIL